MLDRTLLAAVAGSTAMALVACASEDSARTELLLTVNVDREVADGADTLHAKLWIDDPIQGWIERQGREVPLDEDLSVEIPVVAGRTEHESALFEVILEATGPGGSVAWTRVVSRFERGKRRSHAVTLTLCSGPGGESCRDDACHGTRCSVCSFGQCLTATAPVGEGQDGQRDAATVPTNDGSLSPLPSDAGPTDGGLDGATLGPLGPEAAVPQADASVPSDAAPSLDAWTPRAPDASPPLPKPEAGLPPLPIDPSTGVDPHDPACPADHTCKAPYPCITTPVGYTCRGQWADWPMPDGSPGAQVTPSYSASADTVLDNVTKLEWQINLPTVYPGCTHEGDLGAAVSTPKGGLCSLIEARQYCAALEHAGHTDWRLPSIIEFASTLDGGQPKGELGSDPLFREAGDYSAFMTTSVDPGTPSSVWNSALSRRDTYLWPQPRAKVRCVRGGALPPYATPAERYAVDSASDTVTDRATGLVWQRTVPRVLQPWVRTLETHCPAGFRVPTGNELLTLVDYTRVTPALSAAAFPNAPIGEYLAVLEFTGVGFDVGNLRWTAQGYLRCVKK